MCGNLVPQPGIKLVPPAVEAQSLNCWATRDILWLFFFRLYWLMVVCYIFWIMSPSFVYLHFVRVSLRYRMIFSLKLYLQIPCFWLFKRYTYLRIACLFTSFLRLWICEWGNKRYAEFNQFVLGQILSSWAEIQVFGLFTLLSLWTTMAIEYCKRKHISH